MIKPVIPRENQIAIRRLLKLSEHASEESVQAAIEARKNLINSCKEQLNNAEQELASLQSLAKGFERIKRLSLGMSPDATQAEYFEKLRSVFGTDMPIQEVDKAFNRKIMREMRVKQSEKVLDTQA